jgi:PAS domain S-box-containing protein
MTDLLFVSVLFNSAAVVAILFATHDLFEKPGKSTPSQYKNTVIGLLFGFGAISALFVAHVVADGSIVTLHNVFIVIAGSQAGPIGAVVSAATVGLFHFFADSAGPVAELIGLGLSAVSGVVIWHFGLFRRGAGWAVATSLAVTVWILLGFLFVGSFEDGVAHLKSVAIPYGTATLIILLLAGRIVGKLNEKQIEAAARRDDYQRMEEFAESASDWFWEMDADLRLVFLSEGYEGGAEHSSDGWYGKHPWIAAGSDGLDSVWATHREVLKKREPFKNFEYSMTGPDKNTRHYRINGLPVFQNGVFKGYRGSGSNVTIQRNAELKLERQSDLFRSTIDAAPILITVKDRDGRYVYCNLFAAQKWGLQPYDFIGAEIEDVVKINERTRAAIKHHDALVIRTKRAIRFFEDTMTFGDGQRKMLTSKMPILDSEGEVEFVVTIAVDNTDQELVKQDLRDAVVRAEHANRAKSRFLATMSHELRTPLNAILGFSDLMRAEAFGPLGNTRYAEYVGDIHESGTYLLDLVSDLLNLSAIEAGENILNMRPLSVQDTTRKAIEKLMPSADAKGLPICLTVADDVEPVIADERAISQIVFNLVSNAIKFTSSGQITVSLFSVHGAAENQMGVGLVVSDTGIGVPIERLPTIAVPFVQAVEEDAMTARDGIGLGLSIVNSLVKAHAGTMTIDSTPNKGTTVTVTFPNDPAVGYADVMEQTSIAS